MMPNGMTQRLGKVCGKNNSRDWWRAMKKGPVTRPQITFFFQHTRQLTNKNIFHGNMTWTPQTSYKIYLIAELTKEIRKVDAPIKYTDLSDGSEKYRVEKWPIIFPHEIANFLFETSGLRIPAASVREYWLFNRAHGEPWAQDAPLDALPVGIWGDGARVSTKFGFTNLIGIFMNFPLWKPKSVRASRFLITIIPEEKIWRHHTLGAVFRHITWSLNCLIDGQHPSKDAYGGQLPRTMEVLANKPFRFPCRLTEIRGDWQWRKRTWRFPRCSWNGVKVCFHCRALSQSNDVKDLYWSFENNNWSQLFTRDEFMAERVPESGICTQVALAVKNCWFHLCNLSVLISLGPSFHYQRTSCV